MPQASIPKRPLSTTLTLAVLWIVFYGSFTLFRPALLDDADSVHAEVAREMLLRHDYVTLYANGIRYLEKAPLLYWAMAACMRISQLLGHGSANCLAVASRIPLALTVLALAFAVEAFARRAFRSARAGLYAALILVSSPGIFLFTRMNLPDAMVCLWLTLAMLCFWLTERRFSEVVILSEAKNPRISTANLEPRTSNLLCCSAFSACCALNVLTKGLIGAVFPLAIVAIYLLLTRGPRATITRIRQLHPLTSTLVFLVIAAPWHILIALANPTQGNPGNLSLAGGHWQVPLPTDGNVHGWAWFYFVNEQVLRYLNLRAPRDYDTVPLYLFWGLLPHLAHALERIRVQGHRKFAPAANSGMAAAAAHLHAESLRTHLAAARGVGGDSAAVLLAVHAAGVLRAACLAGTLPPARGVAHSHLHPASGHGHHNRARRTI
jgi:4-amino-4-deoxy-L-arabinose transferase-like glycosyltransferase